VEHRGTDLQCGTDSNKFDFSIHIYLKFEFAIFDKFEMILNSNL